MIKQYTGSSKKNKRSPERVEENNTSFNLKKGIVYLHTRKITLLTLPFLAAACLFLIYFTVWLIFPVQKNYIDLPTQTYVYLSLF